MKVIRNSDNKFMNGRYKTVYTKVAGSDDVIEVEEFQVKALAKGAKWESANQDEYRTIKAKTILCTFVDHRMATKKSFKAGKRYQVEQGRVLGSVAGYVFDEDGDRWTLYREEVGFSAGYSYLFEAKYS